MLEDKFKPFTNMFKAEADKRAQQCFIPMSGKGFLGVAF